jgi:anti-anti-sigma factor
MMRRECKIKVHEDNDTATIEIHGDMTASAMKDMDAAQQEVYGYNPVSILVKFSDKTRINSSGIAMLINLVIDSREQGCKVYLTGMSDHFRKIFGLVGLTKYAEIVELKAEESDEGKP